MNNNELLLKWLPLFEELFGKWKVDPDCQQMIYLDFLMYDNEKLNQLDKDDELRFWITRFCKNYWFSNTSRYYTLYKKKCLLPYPAEPVENLLYDEENEY